MSTMRWWIGLSRLCSGEDALRRRYVRHCRLRAVPRVLSANRVASRFHHSDTVALFLQGKPDTSELANKATMSTFKVLSKGELTMTTRSFALAYGVVFLLIGLAGFVPALLESFRPGDPELTVTATSGYLFGLFPVNILHNLTHVAFGIWGLAVMKSISGAITYARAVAIIYALLAVMGLVPGLNNTFGLVPLHGHDVWLHIVLAAGAAYFGFAHNSPRTGD